jgi:hypothetical protein
VIGALTAVTAVNVPGRAGTLVIGTFAAVAAVNVPRRAGTLVIGTFAAETGHPAVRPRAPQNRDGR